ncbi:MAG: hypothetical protein ACTSRW_06595 [Candidatus Helarchaeota archaeon]
MGIGKAFGLGLLIYMGLNFLSHMLLLLLSGITAPILFFIGFMTNPINSIIDLITILLVGPIYTTTLIGAQNSTLIPAGMAIYTHVESIMTAGSTLSVLNLFTSIFNLIIAIAQLLIWLMPYLVTSIVVGYFSGSAGNGFASWFLLMVIVVIVSLVLGLVLVIITGIATLVSSMILGLQTMVLKLVLYGIPAILVNSCFWGVICIGGGFKWEE